VFAPLTPLCSFAPMRAAKVFPSEVKFFHFDGSPIPHALLVSPFIRRVRGQCFPTLIFDLELPVYDFPEKGKLLFDVLED